MRKVEEYFVGKMLRKEESAFLAKGWARIKSLTGKQDRSSHGYTLD